MDFKPRAQHFWYPRFRIQPVFAKISQKQPDFDILNFILLFLKESHIFRIEWTLNHVHSTFGTRDSEFSHSLQKLTKNQPKLPDALISMLRDCFFWNRRLILHKNCLPSAIPLV